jgi:hypothetical protein
MLANLFEIRRPYPSDFKASRLFATAVGAWQTTNPVYGVAIWPRGTALGPHATLPENADLADGQNWLGFVDRDVTPSGPVLGDSVYPNRLELPYTLGGYVSIEKADEVEAEGPTFLLTSGVGALTNLTAVDTPVSFDGGRFYAAQGSDQKWFRVSANNLTPVIAGNLRMRFERNV